MTTLENRPNTALLVSPRDDAVLHVDHEKARREQVPLFGPSIPTSSSYGTATTRLRTFATTASDWRILPELSPGAAEPLVEKHYDDAFEDTTLETVLSGLGVGRLVVVGAETDACIRFTPHSALVRGYDAILVSDAHTTQNQTGWGAPPPDQVIAHTNLYWTHQRAPGRKAGTVETKDVDFGGTS